ncbi:MAG: rhodanese-like domain-containing protein [Opitutae bacterium]|nr:rhodanese-like domain-containing protein [Opitutae bacterium]
MKKLLTTLSSLLLAVVAMAGSSKFAGISHDELLAAVANKSAVILDVNGSDSFKAGHIPGAIDYTAQAENLAALLPADKSALVVAYCGSPACGAYARAASAAAKLGYTNVKHYAPGISGWKKSGAPLEKP